MEAITPADGFLSPASAQMHAYICHMCRKKFACLDLIPAHCVSKVHAKRREQGYRFEEWVVYNLDCGFYEEAVELARPQLAPQAQLGPGPPPPLPHDPRRELPPAQREQLPHPQPSQLPLQPAPPPPARAQQGPAGCVAAQAEAPLPPWGQGLREEEHEV
ncbi:unnamed protein product [Prorocentrum cordatum]|nr:unnamed protein product [Polarella glacialis]